VIFGQIKKGADWGFSTFESLFSDIYLQDWRMIEEKSIG
jgi:hypothetical protein